MIRPAREGDMPRILEIYAAARAFMKTSGYPTQLTDRYPWKRICGRISACSACMWWWRRPSAPASCWLRGPMTPTPIFLTGRGDRRGNKACSTEWPVTARKKASSALRWLLQPGAFPTCASIPMKTICLCSGPLPGRALSTVAPSWRTTARPAWPTTDKESHPSSDGWLFIIHWRCLQQVPVRQVQQAGE